MIPCSFPTQIRQCWDNHWHLQRTGFPGLNGGGKGGQNATQPSRHPFYVNPCKDSRIGLSIISASLLSTSKRR